MRAKGSLRGPTCWTARAAPSASHSPGPEREAICSMSAPTSARAPKRRSSPPRSAAETRSCSRHSITKLSVKPSDTGSRPSRRHRSFRARTSASPTRPRLEPRATTASWCRPPSRRSITRARTSASVLGAKPLMQSLRQPGQPSLPHAMSRRNSSLDQARAAPERAVRKFSTAYVPGLAPPIHAPNPGGRRCHRVTGLTSTWSR